LKYLENIHIYEAEWNAITGIKWKEASKESEDRNMLQPNQLIAGNRSQQCSHYSSRYHRLKYPG
jgi:hypothetical protein